MGREQRRKEQKKYKNKVKENDITNESFIKISSALKIIIGVGIVILLFYYGLALFVTKEVDLKSNKKDNDTTTESASSVSNPIIAKNTFLQTDEVYYVYYYDFNDEYDSISSSMNNLTDHTIYRVNTKDGLNSNYITEDTGNRKVSSINDLKVKNPTLIKIDNDKVTGYYEGIGEIGDFLNK